MRTKRLAAATALFFLFTVTPALAETKSGPTDDEVRAFEEMFGKGPQEEEFYRNDRLLLTATGSLKPVHLAPSVASVITAEEIRNMGATTLDEVLETVPGLHVQPSGSNWFASIWSIRGLHTSTNPHVLMLVNGVPFTSNYQGSRPLGYRMPVAMISRVEVVRGPGSALHGADAYAGVINVITKDNFEIEGTETGLRYGSFDTKDAWLQHGRQYGGWDLALSLEWQKAQGDHDREVEKDYLHAIGAGVLSNAPGHLDTSYELLDAHLNLRRDRWELHVYGTLQETAVGPGGAQALTYENDLDSESLLVDLSYSSDELLDNWVLTAKAYYSYMYGDGYIQFFPSDFLNMIGNPIFESQDGGLEVNGVYSGVAGHEIRLGAGLKNYDFTPDQYKNFGPAAAADPFGRLVHVTDPNHIYIEEGSRRLWYALAQDEWQFARDWTLTAGVRYDEYSDFGSTTNPRAALVWETRYDLTTKLMYGRAFRGPSFAEQNIKNNPVTVGNPDLSPEEIETLELAFDYQPLTDLRLILSLFSYKAEELIEQTGPLPQKFMNIGEQEGEGFELEMDWQLLENLRLRSNFAYQRSENERLDAVVPNAPEMQFYISPQWDFREDWSLNGQLFWIADRHRAQGDPRDAPDDYEVVNLTLRRKNPAGHWEAAVSIRNLFDENGRIPSPYDAAAPGGAYIPEDYPIEGRSVYGELIYRF